MTSRTRACVYETSFTTSSFFCSRHKEFVGCSQLTHVVRSRLTSTSSVHNFGVVLYANYVTHLFTHPSRCDVYGFPMAEKKCISDPSSGRLAAMALFFRLLSIGILERFIFFAVEISKSVKYPGSPEECIAGLCYNHGGRW